MNDLDRTALTNSSFIRRRRSAVAPARCAALSLAFAAASGLAALGCSTQEAASPAEGEVTASVRGALQGFDPGASTAPALRAVLVWTYWDAADCQPSPGPEEGEGCSGSLLATEAALVDDGGHFVLGVSAPPPAFVHGYDVATAEAFIAVVAADADLETTDFTDPANRVGLSSDHVVLYAPQSFDEDTVEAALVGGPLGAGFHLVAAGEGPQFEVVLEDGTEVISVQRGTLAPAGFETEIVVTPGAEYSPWLGL